jgi:hypothetical protein
LQCFGVARIGPQSEVQEILAGLFCIRFKAELDQESRCKVQPHHNIPEVIGRIHPDLDHAHERSDNVVSEFGFIAIEAIV